MQSVVLTASNIEFAPIGREGDPDEGVGYLQYLLLHGLRLADVPDEHILVGRVEVLLPVWVVHHIEAAGQNKECLAVGTEHSANGMGCDMVREVRKMGVEVLELCTLGHGRGDTLPGR